ncbi:developmentally Regulated MAPK Interacting protein [Colletotrichum paranaense]|uniref:Extracellular conserved serine-rich protein n=6 Tax=Colletotrichum acutatum species complex TaxID=2707335 RepID=A0A9P7R1Z9_9PEZI|nr:developmentally Regulated MAPK Interacting protein [Colletotrichum scovillei]XP_060306894.1 developmentally Regulated MAPK Interacting protein [Colletotrichum costaricense]XP_060346372.1 developmentally Regulated MAPK Interacting protein [Colletotrichum paranaense]XP_060393079.1 developmentally Regulated MAPK Interacting protein [Colletotrichum abscissum]KAK1458210.1 developmentally Regulated MAPK Interacting protein [Colletotrichum melonis]KXH29231.1 developmentally Regulated MAPK Interact
MFSKTAVAITSFLAIAEAVKVTKPAKGDDWDLSKTNEITWETVSSDPKSFEIVIVNQSGYPEVSETIATVQAADGKYELKGAKVAAGDAYRINLVSVDPQNSGILAQSNEFSFTGSDDSSSASASGSATASASASGSAATASATGSSSSASGSAATATVTQTSGLTTVTTVTTGSATASASGTAASNASGSGTASGTATGSAASGTSTSAPSSASAIKSTFAIFGSVAVAAYMLF